MRTLLALVTVVIAAVSAERDTDLQKNAEPTCCRSVPRCKPSPYRTYDGSCNNLKHPLWATSNSVYERFLETSYSDGADAFPTSKNNKTLMNPRDMSLLLFPDVFVEDPIWTLITVNWGQIVAHDMSLTGGVPQTGVDNVLCCTNGEPIPQYQSDRRCFPIPIPKDDPYNAPEGNTCINFYRTISTRILNCSASGNAEQFSSVTGYLDLSLVYGNNETQAKAVRANKDGKLAYELRNGKPWLPQNSNVTFACDGVKSKEEPCYRSGDVRVNQNPQLAMLQTILMREHNRIAETLLRINPHWNDERCFQETRRILIAQAQHITYNEFLYFVLGEENLKKKGIIYPDVNGFVDDYDENVNAQTLNEHATAAYRLFHSEIVGQFKKYTEGRKCTGSLRLSDWYGRPSIIEEGETFCELTRGLSTQQQEAVDRFFDEEVTQYFFRPKDKKLGDDLQAIDIQRARDHGLGTYASALRACNLSDPKSFRDLEKYIPPLYVKLLEQIYNNPDDVELLVAIHLETLVNGTLAGPTSLCIMLEQFWRTRVGDRYFYAHGKTEGAFTLKQLQSIQKGASMARLLCDNVKCVKKIQPRAFHKITETNPLTKCNCLPQVDLMLWKEKPKKKTCTTDIS